MRTLPFEDYAEGARAALDYAKKQDMPLIALGSLYMYQQFTDALKDIINK
jgi:dihydrofolate synthase/folylpolyglutamate synthase